MTIIFAICVFALTMSITPGPVNIVTLSSGGTNGIRKTIPYVSGATVGFTALLFLLGIGGIGLLSKVEGASDVIAMIGCGYILYMAYKISSASGDIETEETKVPRFIDGALMQWLNPKAWIACFSGVAAFVSPENGVELITFGSLYFVCCYIGVGFWAVVGAQAGRFLTTPKQLQRFNQVMGTVLALVAIYLFTQNF